MSRNIEDKLNEIINRLNKMDEDYTKYKETIDNIIIMNTNLVQEIANQINTKIDILCNLDNITSNSSAKPASVKKNKSLTKTSFFKDKLKSNLNEFVDVLYTENEIKELYNNPEVKTKKTETSKKNKIIDLLYNNITKNDEIKHNKLKELYDNYKKNLDNIYDSDEETKSEN